VKTLTIELNDDLEKEIETLSAQEGRDEVVVVMEVIKQGLSEKQRRQQVRKALEEVLSKPVDGPDVSTLFRTKFQAALWSCSKASGAR
jgi:predicted transcriptional regulator